MNKHQRLAKRAFDGVVSYAIMRSDHGRVLERLRNRGEEIPDQYLPGRVVMMLRPDAREALKDLTSAMTQNERYI